MLVVGHLVGRVDAHDGVKDDSRTAALGRGDDPHFFGLALIHTLDVEGFPAREAQALRRIARLELKRQHAHADQVRAVDALEALGDDGPDAEQARPLGGPVARGTRAVFLTAQNDEGNPRLLVFHRRVVDGHDLVFREIGGEAALGSRGRPVAQTHVREGAAHHHLVVPAPRAIAVEIGGQHVVHHEELATRAVAFDGARRRDMVRRHRIAQKRQAARAPDVLYRLGVGLHAVEIRRFPDVGGHIVPLEKTALGRRDALPAQIAPEHVVIAFLEHVRLHMIHHHVLNLALGGPDVPEIHRVALLVLAQGVFRDVEIHASGDGVGHHKGR